MGNYQETLRELKGRRSRKVANNTYLELDDIGDAIYLRLHATRIITWRPDGSITLNDGNWPTATTKERMDRWLPSGLRLASDSDGAWAVYKLTARNPLETEFSGYVWTGRRYFKGMRIDEDGNVLNPEVREGRYSDVYTESGW